MEDQKKKSDDIVLYAFVAVLGLTLAGIIGYLIYSIL